MRENRRLVDANNRRAFVVRHTHTLKCQFLVALLMWWLRFKNSRQMSVDIFTFDIWAKSIAKSGKLSGITSVCSWVQFNFSENAHKNLIEFFQINFHFDAINSSGNFEIIEYLTDFVFVHSAIAANHIYLYAHCIDEWTHSNSTHASSQLFRVNSHK